ncbi:MAG: tetratricopeptide repeat protein [Verrucomicrobiota bacterium]
MRRWSQNIAVTLALAVACLLGTMQAGADSFNQKLRQAHEHLAAREYEKAVEVLEQLDRPDQDKAMAHRLLGYAYRQLGQNDKARASFVAALSQGGLSPDTLDGLVQIDYEQDRQHTLLVGLGLRVLMSPTNTTWALAYADALTAGGRNDEARNICETILKRSPHNARIYICLGNAHLMDNAEKEAVGAFQSAYWLGSHDSGLAARIAGLWHNLGNTKTSVRWYERAIKADPGNSTSLRMRAAELRFANGDIEKAIGQLETLAQSTDNAVAGKALFMLGHAAIRKDRKAAAVEHFQEAMAKGYVQPDIVAYVAAHFIEQDKAEKAVSLIAEHKANLPFNAAIEHKLAFKLIETNRLDLARHHLRRYMEHRGLDETAKRMLAMLSEAQTAQSQ